MTDQEKLQVIYDGFANNESTRALFIGIADYIQFIDHSSTLSSIVKRKVIRERDQRLKELDKLGETLLKESYDTFDKLKHLVKTNNIKNPDVDKELEDYRRVLSKEIQYSSTFPEAVSHSVDMIITAIKEADYTDLVRDYVKLDEHDNITSWTFADSYRPYMDLLAQLRQQHKTAIWGYWDELYRVYEVIEKKDQILADLKKNNDNMGMMNFYGLVNEMNQILEEKSGFTPVYFKGRDFRSYLNRFHSIIKIQMPEPRIRSLTGPSVKSPESELTLAEPEASLGEMTRAIANLTKRVEELTGSQSTANVPDKVEDSPGLIVTPDGGFTYNGRLLKGISIDTQIGKLLALLTAHPLVLVSYEVIEKEAGSEDPRGAGFIKRNLQKALKENDLKLELETRRNKGYTFIGVSELNNSP